MLIACGPSPEAADVDDGACAERFDPLRDDDRTPFGLRPNQLRAQLGATISGSTEAGEAVDVTPVWLGGLAIQVWADEVDGVDAPDPRPPLWCEDRAEIPAVIRVEAPSLPDRELEIPGVVRAVGPLGDLRAAFVGESELWTVWVRLEEGTGVLSDAGGTILEWSF